jgi:hypothetical protein
MGKLKAKHIAKLRKKAKLMQTYKVRDSWGLFGFDTFRTHDFTEIRANSERKAMQIYFQCYYRIMKRLHRFHEVDTITTYDWGRIEVVNENGYATYFK